MARVDFNKGSEIKLLNGNVIKIIDKLGEGGQGIVYKVHMNSKEYALKWYSCRFENKKLFKENMEKNILDKSPNNKFLWPIALTEERNGSFGYIMDLRPKDFCDFSDILNNKVKFKSTNAVIDAALNIVQGFGCLHRVGKTYQDLNDGNFFINVENGDVLICDNDNVTPYDKKNPGNIAGKPGYMAPEIVCGNAYPGCLTDAHSLAVILFKLFCHHDPLMGRKYVEAVCITEDKERELYGTNPLFIFDPNDSSNRPVQGIHPNPIKMWPRFPNYIRKGFETSFCEGMKNPNARLTERMWLKLLIKYKSDILSCPVCGAEIIIPEKANSSLVFPCNHKFPYPLFLSVADYKVPLFPNLKMYECYTTKGSEDFSTITGEVIMNKNNPNLWGIKNLSNIDWSFITETGEVKHVGTNSVIPIMPGLKIKFNQIDAEILR